METDRSRRTPSLPSTRLPFGRAGRWASSTFGTAPSQPEGEYRIGPGDTLDITVSGIPAFDAGELRLSDLRLEAPDSAYFELASGLLRSQLEKRLRVPIRARLEEALSLVSAATAVRFTLTRFEVPAIAVDEAGLRLTIEERVQAR